MKKIVWVRVPEMKKKKDVELVAKNLEMMEIELVINENSIELRSDNLTAVMENDSYRVSCCPSAEMDAEIWEKYSGEVDNMNRAILQIKGIQNLLIN